MITKLLNIFILIECMCEQVEPKSPDINQTRLLIQ